MSKQPEKTTIGSSSTTVKTANNAVSRKGARALQDLVLRARDGEWTLQINLALIPSSPGGSPGTDGSGSTDAPGTDGSGSSDAPGTDGSGSTDAPGTDGSGSSDAPDTDGSGSSDAPGSKAVVQVHAPIELRGASISVRFATHSAKAFVRSAEGKRVSKAVAKRGGNAPAAKKPRKE